MAISRGSDWLTKGIPKRTLAKEKREALEEAAPYLHKMTRREAQMILSKLILEDKVEGDEAKAVIVALRALNVSEKMTCCRKYGIGIKCFCNYGERREPMTVKELWKYSFKYPSHLQIQVDGKIKTISDFLEMEQMIDKYADYIVAGGRLLILCLAVITYSS